MVEMDILEFSEETIQKLVGQMIYLGHAKPQHPGDLTTECPTTVGQDAGCNNIVPVSSGGLFYSLNGLLEKVSQIVNSKGGRLAIDKVACVLHVDRSYFEPHALKNLPTTLSVLGNHFVFQSYWEALCRQLSNQVAVEGRVSLLSFAASHDVRVDHILQECLPQMQNVTLLQNNLHVLLSNTYLANMQQDVLTTFKELKDPQSILSVCNGNMLDFELTLEWLIANKDIIQGEIRMDPTTRRGAVFVPHQYRDSQEELFLDALSSNGYIKLSNWYEISPPRAHKVVRNKFLHFTVLGDYLFLEYFLQNLKNIIEDLPSRGTIDLSDFLNAELMTPGVFTAILEEIGFSKENGFSIQDGQGEAWLVSHQFVEDNFAQVVLPLVKGHAKKVAEELLLSGQAAQFHSMAKFKPFKKKTQGGKMTIEMRALVVPLRSVAMAMQAVHSTLGGQNWEQNLSQLPLDFLDWDCEENSGVLLVEFCKAFNTDVLQSLCIQAVLAELTVLDSLKHSKATLHRMHAAPMANTTDSAFDEDVFATSCYTLQSFSKFIKLAAYSTQFDALSLASMEREFLVTLCADFTSQITQYCLLKAEVPPFFTFSRGCDDSRDGIKLSQPSFFEFDCLEMRTMTMPFLSCPPPKEPLDALKDLLPKNIGVTLARQWRLCGGDCYLGGTSEGTSGGSSQAQPGNVERFLQHVTENCLNTCGIPFKRLDKKSEKKFLLTRKRRLSTLLETQPMANAQTILELTIILLFQQVRNVAVTGTFLRGPILKMLCRERKISEQVERLLLTMNNKIENGDSIDSGLIRAVRECGLSRDIGKHEVKYFQLAD